MSMSDTQRSNVTSSAQLANVEYSDIHWDQLFDPKTGEYKSINQRGKESFDNPLSDYLKSYGKQKAEPTPTGLALELLVGFDASVSGVIHVTPLTVKESERAVKQRRKQIELWKAADNVAYTELAATAELVWGFVDKDGKKVKVADVPKPQHAGNMGFRRGYATMGAIARREEGTSFPFAVAFVEYADELERILAHAAENLKKTAGASKLAPLDYVIIACSVVDEGGRESHLTNNNVKRGTAQKTFAFAKLDRRFPELKLVERVLMDPPELPKGITKYPYGEGCYIPFSMLDTTALRHLDKGTTEVAAASKPDEVESYIALVMNDKKAAKRTMTRADIEAKADSHKCQIVRIVCKAILENNTKVFSKLVKIANQLNDATIPHLVEMELMDAPKGWEPSTAVEEPATV